MKGKCVSVPGIGKGPPSYFVMGGCRYCILMSHKLLQDLYPRINSCRRQFKWHQKVMCALETVSNAYYQPGFAGGNMKKKYCSTFLFPGNIGKDKLKTLSFLQTKSLVTKFTRRIRWGCDGWMKSYVILPTYIQHESVTPKTLGAYSSYWYVNETGFPLY